MHPTTPFNTQSGFNRVAEVAAWAACAAFIYWRRWEGLPLPTIVAVGVVVAGYIFMRFCSLVHWHKDAERGEGIEQQFIQVSVAAIYGLLIATVAALAHTFVFLVYAAAVIFAGVSAINATLLYLYHKDTSKIPINYYSHKKFIQEDA